jgi:hypothetical protein
MTLTLWKLEIQRLKLSTIDGVPTARVVLSSEEAALAVYQALARLRVPGPAPYIWRDGAGAWGVGAQVTADQLLRVLQHALEGQ